MVDPPKKRVIDVYTIRRGGEHELLIKAICAGIRYRVGDRVVRNHHISQSLESLGIEHKDFEITDSPIVNPSEYLLNQSLLIDVTVGRDKITILMSIYKDGKIKFGIGVNTDELWRMEEL